MTLYCHTETQIEEEGAGGIWLSCLGSTHTQQQSAQPRMLLIQPLPRKHLSIHYCKHRVFFVQVINLGLCISLFSRAMALSGVTTAVCIAHGCKVSPRH